MMKNVIVFLMMSLFIFAPQSRAGVLIEPYLGYSFGSGDVGTTDLSYNSPTMGARLGYQTFGLMFGLDYSMQSFEMDFDFASGSTASLDFKKNQLGVFVGYELPILLRAYAAYYVSSKLEFDSGQATGSELDGGGYMLGAGFTGLPFVSLNLEYRVFEYDEFSGQTISPVYKMNEIMLSVSLPLNL